MHTPEVIVIGAGKTPGAKGMQDFSQKVIIENCGGNDTKHNQKISSRTGINHGWFAKNREQRSSEEERNNTTFGF